MAQKYPCLSPHVKSVKDYKCKILNQKCITGCMHFKWPIKSLMKYDAKWSNKCQDIEIDKIWFFH